MTIYEGFVHELEQEHRLIERMLYVLKKTPEDVGVFDRVMRFFSSYADLQHHTAEEEVLFRWIERTGGAHGGPSCSLFMGYQMNWNPVPKIRQICEGEGVLWSDAGLSKICTDLITKNSLLTVPIEDHIAGRLALTTLKSIYRRELTSSKYFDLVNYYIILLQGHIRKEEECLFKGALQQFRSFQGDYDFQSEISLFDRTKTLLPFNPEEEVKALEVLCG